MNMNLSELINEIISEWAYRVDDGQPNPKNPKHLVELSIVLSEMGLSHIKDELFENITEADKQFTNPILNKIIKYKNKKGEDKEGMVGNLLRLPKDNPGRVAAEKLLPADAADKDAAMKDLGSEKDGKSTKKPGDEEKPKDDKEAGAKEPKEDPIKAAAPMFDPKVDPAMGARLDREKEANAKIAADKAEDEPKSDNKPEVEFSEPTNPPPQNEKGVEKDGKIAGTTIETEPALQNIDPEFLKEKSTEMNKYYDDFKEDKKKAEGIAREKMGYSEEQAKGLKGEEKSAYDKEVKKNQQPTYNLCKVSLPNSNLFCSGNKGIPRKDMPQFKGEPVEGTQAWDVLQKAKEKDPTATEAEGEPYFRQMLADKGIKVTDAEVPSESLKATQTELVGDKVLGMKSVLDAGPSHPAYKKMTSPLFVSKDGYIVDGHHRWAAITAYNMEHPDNPLPLKTMIIDQNIDDAIETSNTFANEFGVAAKSGQQTGAAAQTQNEPPANEPSRPNTNPIEDKSSIESMKGESKTIKGKKSGKDIQTIEMEGGGMVYGTQHENTAMVDDIIDDIKSKIPKERWKDIVFVGEGGATNNDGELEFHDEMDYAAPKFKELGADIDSWDGDDLDVHNSESKLYKKQKEKTGLEDNQILAGNWASMIGQGEGQGLDPNDPDNNMKAEDYLDDDGKQFLQDAAKEAGLPPIENFDNPTGEKPSEENGWEGTGDRGTLYRLAFPKDNGDKETKINDIQVAFNETRDENILEKTKELQAKGKIPITIAGEGHIDLVNGMMKNENTQKEMKEENLQLAHELMLEMIYEFIDEAKPNAKAQRILNQRIKYKEDGVEHDVKVSTAIKYKNSEKSGQKKAYKDALALLKKSGVNIADTGTTKKPVGKPIAPSGFRVNKKEEPIEPQTVKSTKVNSIGDAILSTSKQKGDDKKKAFVEKKKDELNKLLFSMGDNNKLALVDENGKSVSVNTAKLSKVIDKVFSGSPLNDDDKKLFNSCLKLVTNPDNGDVKIYVSSKIMGRHPQQGYKSVEIAKDNIPMGDSIRNYALQNGLNVGKSSEGAIGKKVLTPTKMAASVNPNKPETIIEIKKTANGVTIGGKEMKRLKELNYDGLVKSLTPKYGPEEAAKKAKLLVLQTKAYNQKLDDLAKIGENSGGKIPMANFGDVTTPENRKKTASNVLDGIVKRFETELDNFGKQFGKPDLKNTPENKKVFDSLNKLKTLNKKYNLETDEKARAEYKATLDQLLLDMANSPDFKDSVADFAEQKAGLQFMAEGKQVYFPASENFQTADIIVMPDEFSVKPKKGQTTEEAIAENLQFYSVTVTYVGGLSVKYKGGGGSANYSKIEQTEYNNPETKSKLLEMQNVYSLAYPKDKKNQLNIKDADVKAANKKIEDTIQWAIKAKLITKEEADLIRRIGAGQAANTLKGSLKDVAKCKGSNRKNFEQSIVLHHTMMHLTAVLNNRDMSYTRFSNFNEEVSQNKNGDATKITDDIADGVNKPCYMNPHHNPGFSTSPDETSGCVTGAPTNQNPSHIESEQPKNLLKAPK